MGSSTSLVLCKFAVEEHYCNSFSPVVVPCIDYLTDPIEHTWGNWEVAQGSTVGVAATETIEVAVVETAEVIGPGMPLGDTVVDTGWATPGTTLIGLGAALAIPGVELVVGPGAADFSTLFGSTVLTLVPCSL